MKHKLRLDTYADMTEFVQIVTQFKFKIVLESSDGFRVNAKSLLGVMATTDFNDIWVVSEKDIHSSIRKFVI